GETPGKVYELVGESTMIGRDLGCDIVLSRKFVSRKHARIIRTSDGYHIEDLESNCGTQVEGDRIGRPVPLRDGQHIKIGNYLFLYNAPAVMVTDSDERSSTIIGVLELGKPTEVPDSTVHPRERLQLVLDISRRLGESLHLEDVLEKTLDSLFKLF